MLLSKGFKVIKRGPSIASSYQGKLRQNNICIQKIREVVRLIKSLQHGVGQHSDMKPSNAYNLKGPTRRTSHQTKRNEALKIEFKNANKGKLQKIIPIGKIF